MVRGRGVALAYGSSVAVAASDFGVPRGRVTSLIGPNGSGKSSLLHAIAGLLEPAGGVLEVSLPEPRYRHVAYVLQSTKVNETMPVTVREVVAMGRYARLGPYRPLGRADRRACETVMDRLGIRHLAGRHLDLLSGGERQRAFVAQGLVQEADLLLLDEPVTGLDLLSRRTILEIVEEERSRGATVIVTTHDLDEAAAADHVLLLASEVVGEGPADAVLTPEGLEEAYGARLVELGAGRVLLDDPHHRAVAGRHVHFDRTGHGEHGPAAD